VNMRNPSGVAVDASGNLYVADSSNSRVLFFPSGSSTGAAATKVWGEPDFNTRSFATTATNMWAPFGLAADSHGNLYVADSVNHRVLFFPAGSASGAAATKVLGQPDFTHAGAGTTASSL